MDAKKNCDLIVGIIAQVTQCSAKEILNGTTIEQMFEGQKDDIWLYFDFCERLEKEFAIKLSTKEQLQMLDMHLSELETFLSTKQNAVS